MKPIKSIVAGIALVSFQSVAQPNYQFYAEPHLVSGLQNTAFTAGAGGAFGFYINRKSSVDLRARELYNVNGMDMIGSITASYRYHFASGLFLGGGFAHHHEIGIHDFAHHPAESAMGTSKDIDHRTGAMIEAGYVFNALGQGKIFQHIYPVVGLSASYMLDSGPNPLVTANIGIRYSWKKL